MATTAVRSSGSGIRLGAELVIRGQSEQGWSRVAYRTLPLQALQSRVVVVGGVGGWQGGSRQRE